MVNPESARDSFRYAAPTNNNYNDPRGGMPTAEGAGDMARPEFKS